MTKPRVFVTRILPDRGLQKVLAQTDATVWQEELPPPRAVLLDWARQADGLLTLLTDKIDAELLDAAPHLKVVANFAVGFDNFDVPAATQRRVLMTNTPGVLTDTTADLAFTLLMACARRIVEGHTYAKNGHWGRISTAPPSGSPASDASGWPWPAAPAGSACASSTTTPSAARSPNRS